MKKVLILGGGFAGLEAAIFLRKYGFYPINVLTNIVSSSSNQKMKERWK